jgi:hypothetical protein
MILRALLVVGSAVLAGCVSTKTTSIAKESSGLFSGKTLSYVSREKPDFGAITAGKMMFGAIGGIAAISAGNKIVAENNIEDPAGSMAAGLSREIANRYGASVVDLKNVATKGADIRKMAAAHAAADLLLDVQTVNWSFSYFPTDWNSYRVVYSVKLRLIDTKSAKLLAEGFCFRSKDKSEDAPSYDELMADGAARLKKEINQSADSCRSELGASVFKL